ncbi:MAG: Hsp20/alpha crystallin family protein [Deltaproteobacteria bacterium]|jgi:HSP20 family protein|nr:Hsp20/alpha crystallin family protein [Deltaproteobacteria bacterium]
MAIFRYPGWRWPDLPGAREDFEKARRQMDRLLSVFSGGGETVASSGVFPPVIVSEDEDKIYVEAEISGIKAEDLDISVVGRTLTISGERKPEEAQNVNYHRRERKWGSFRKALTLPEDVNTEAVLAECKDGLLKLVLPKPEHVKPRKITIQGQ